MWIVAAIAFGVIWGCVVNAVIRNRGYEENWFWWGFFFGVFALIVACTKPEVKREARRSDTDIYNYNNLLPTTGVLNRQTGDERTLAAGSWRCVCGRVNEQRAETCACGRSKSGEKAPEEKKVPQEEKEPGGKSEQDNITALKGYKELLEQGVITQAEFDEKKKQLLGICSI